MMRIRNSYPIELLPTRLRMQLESMWVLDGSSQAWEIGGSFPMLCSDEVRAAFSHLELCGSWETSESVSPVSPLQRWWKKITPWRQLSQFGHIWYLCRMTPVEDESQGKVTIHARKFNALRNCTSSRWKNLCIIENLKGALK